MKRRKINPLRYAQLDYSLVCSKCTHRFDVPLASLTKVDAVLCPSCKKPHDIRESKKDAILQRYSLSF